MTRLLAQAPYFRVADIHRAADFYRDVLGFKIDRLWGEPACFAMPHRDGLTIMLSQVCQGEPLNANGVDGETWDAYFWVTDADALFAQFKSRGAPVVYEPRDMTYYNNREFAIRDPDGHILAFAHDLTQKK